MLIVSSIIVRNGYLDKKITERNEKVVVRVIDCYETGKRNYFLKFEFENKIVVKRTKAKYCRNLIDTNQTELLTNENHNRFIFIDEYETDNDFLFGFILSGFALVIIFKGYNSLKRM